MWKLKTNEISVIDFWKTQTSSLHRSSDPKFYERKALEHASLMTSEERSSPCLDLGCGAGELLEYLQRHVNVTTGLDYSESMLEVARQRLNGSGITLTNADLFQYLKFSTEQTWMTTGAINQYLDSKSLQRFLELFRNNEKARSLYLFDCVDPIRYFIWPFGLSYLPEQKKQKSLRTYFRFAYRYARRAYVCMKLAVGLLDSSEVKLGIGMGYAYSPNQWRSILKSFDLDCEIVSSMFYEYRFHVIIRK